MDHTDTLQLILRSREGDALAVEALIRAHETRVYRLAVSMLDDPAEADEATQEAFIRAIERLDTFRGEASFATWVYAIALNVCRGRLRKRRARARLTQILRTLLRVESALLEDTAIDRESHDAVWNAIHALDDKHREVIVLRYFHDLRQEDIARVLGVTDRTVRARLSAAHTRLREVLKGSVDLE
ncbi:MAG: sigma-70 family RNA polymerase sigma factor [Anaerolineae bacterium]